MDIFRLSLKNRVVKVVAMWAFLFVLAGIAAVYVLLYAIVRIFGERIAFPAPKARYAFDASGGYVWLDTPEKIRLAGIWLPFEGADYTLLYSHGNGEDIGEIRERLESFRKLGFNVFCYDYPGYGRSEGKPSESGLYMAAESAWNYLTLQRGIAPKNIAVLGYSMGSAAACYLASKHEVRALVVVGGFATALHAVLPRNIFPWVHMLDNEHRIGQVKCPVYLLHGTCDRIVPFRNGKRLYAAAKQPKYFARVHGAGHYSIPEKAPDRYWEGIARFVRTLEAEDSDY